MATDTAEYEPPWSAAAAAARARLERGHDMQAVFEELARATTGSVALIGAVRDATQLGLQTAIVLVGTAQSGRSLRHLHLRHFDLLLRLRDCKGGRWWPRQVCNAFIDDEPWLTLACHSRHGFPSKGTMVLGGDFDAVPAIATEFVFPATRAQRDALHARLENELEGAPGWTSYTFEELCNELDHLTYGYDIWREHVTVTRRTEALMTCRFEFE